MSDERQSAGPVAKFGIVDGVPHAGDRAFPWAVEVRDKEIDRYYELNGDRWCHWNRGFHLKFENGWTLSIQWGWGSYCEHYRRGLLALETEPVEESPDAEIAAWDRHKNWYQLGDYDDVLGYQTVDQVLGWIEKISQFDSDLMAELNDDCVQVEHSDGEAS